MPVPRPSPLRAAALALLLPLAGCGSVDEAVEQGRPVEEIYNAALDYLFDGEYSLAVKEFEEVERSHPYSQWATRAQLMVPYANYLRDDYDQAVAAAERFIELHPGSDEVPYARHLIALCYYERIPDVRRDQSITEKARDALEGVISRYPDSDYARDAAVKLDLVYEHLAGKEMEVGRTYQLLRHYPGALQRFGNVVRRFPRTAHAPEALARLVETYLALGADDEARAHAAVLGHNFPATDWYAYAYDLVEGRGPDAVKGGSPRRFLGLF